MSTTTNNQSTVAQAAVITPPPSKGSKSPLFEVGMSGLVSAALLEVQKILMKVANLQGDQFEKQIEAAKTVAKDLGEFQIQAGVEQFKQALVQGLTQVGGGLLSVGTVAAGYAYNSISVEPQVEAANQQVKGMENYKTAITERTSNPSIVEEGSPTVLNEEETAAQTQTQQNQDTRFNQLKDQNAEKFVENKKAVEVNETDQQVINNLKPEQAEDLKASLTAKQEAITKSRDALVMKMSSTTQSISTVGQGLGSVVAGSGTAGAAIHLEDKAKEDANATEAQAALQGFQQISGITQGQFTKLTDASLAISDNLKAVAAANQLANA